MKLRTMPKAANRVWNKHFSNDTWNCEYVYEHGARAIWDAAIRYERKRLAKLLGIKQFPKRIRRSKTR